MLVELEQALQMTRRWQSAVGKAMVGLTKHQLLLMERFVDRHRTADGKSKPIDSQLQPIIRNFIHQVHSFNSEALLRSRENLNAFLATVEWHPTHYDGTRDPRLVRQYMSEIRAFCERFSVPDPVRPLIFENYLRVKARRWWQRIGHERDESLSTIEPMFYDRFLPLKYSAGAAMKRLYRLKMRRSLSRYLRRLHELLLAARVEETEEKLFFLQRGLPLYYRHVLIDHEDEFTGGDWGKIIGVLRDYHSLKREFHHCSGCDSIVTYVLNDSDDEDNHFYLEQFE